MSRIDQRPAVVELPDEAATAAFAEDVAARLAPGTLVALSGGLGAGKTTLARAVLRALADDPALEVPSPTFTLVQPYRAGRLAVSHVDLYRLGGAADLEELGLGDALAAGAVLLEWPERAGDRLPGDRIDIALTMAGRGRRATVTGEGRAAAALARGRAARAFINAAGWQGASRRHLQGDASSRTFERVRLGDRAAVLMDWTPGSQLPAGDPRAPFRARDLRATIAVDDALRGAGLSAPEIYAADPAAGFLLMEDFGREGIVVEDAADPERYRVAVEMLAAIHAEARPDVLPVRGGGSHRLPDLGRAALMAEVGNFLDWYIPVQTGRPVADTARATFLALWSTLADRLAGAERSWVLFDAQSANLFWLPERQSVARVGIIDFQDMFVGPAAYDVASLCQDARVTVSEGLERDLRAHYLSARLARDPAFDRQGFADAYAIAGAARAIKNAGVFSRLAASGKANYLNHLPRMRAYLARLFREPVLSSLALWYDENLTS